MDSTKDPGGSSSNKWRGIAKKGKRRDVGLFSLTDKQDDDTEKRGSVPYMPAIDKLLKDASKSTPPSGSSSRRDETSHSSLGHPKNSRSSMLENTSRTITMASWSSGSNPRTATREDLVKSANNKSRKSFDVMLAQSEEPVLSAAQQSRTTLNKLDKTSLRLKRVDDGSSASSGVAEGRSNSGDKWKGSRIAGNESNSNDSDRKLQDKASLKVASSHSNRANSGVTSSSMSNNRKEQQSNLSLNDICAISPGKSSYDASNLVSPNKPKKIRFGYMRPSNWKKDDKYIKKTVVKKCLNFVKLGLSQKGLPPASTSKNNFTTDNDNFPASRSVTLTSSDSVTKTIKSCGQLKGGSEGDKSSKTTLTLSRSDMSRVESSFHDAHKESTAARSRSSSGRSSRNSSVERSNEKSSRGDCHSNRRESLAIKVGNASHKSVGLSSKREGMSSETENTLRRKDSSSSRRHSKSNIRDSCSSKKDSSYDSISSREQSPSNRKHCRGSWRDKDKSDSLPDRRKSLTDKRDHVSDGKDRTSRRDSLHTRREEKSSKSSFNRRDSPYDKRTSRPSRADSPSHRKKSFSSGRDSPSDSRDRRSSRGSKVSNKSDKESRGRSISLASQSFETISKIVEPKKEDGSSKTRFSNDELSSKTRKSSNDERNQNVPNATAQSRMRSRSCDGEKTDTISHKQSSVKAVTKHSFEATESEPKRLDEEQSSMVSSPEGSKYETPENEDCESLPDIEGSSSFGEKENASKVVEDKDDLLSIPSPGPRDADQSDNQLLLPIDGATDAKEDADQSYSNSENSAAGNSNRSRDVCSAELRITDKRDSAGISNFQKEMPIAHPSKDKSAVSCDKKENSTISVSIKNCSESSCDTKDSANEMSYVFSDSVQPPKLDIDDRQLKSSNLTAQSPSIQVNESTQPFPGPKKVKLDRKSFHMSDTSKEVLDAIIKDLSPEKFVNSKTVEPTKADHPSTPSAQPDILSERSPTLHGSDHKHSQAHCRDKKSANSLETEKDSENQDSHENKLAQKSIDNLVRPQKATLNSGVKESIGGVQISEADLTKSSLSLIDDLNVAAKTSEEDLKCSTWKICHSSEANLESSSWKTCHESTTIKQESLENDSIDFVDIAAFQLKDDENELAVGLQQSKLSDSVVRTSQDPLSESCDATFNIDNQVDTESNSGNCTRVLRKRHCSQSGSLDYQPHKPDIGSTVDSESSFCAGSVLQSTEIEGIKDVLQNTVLFHSSDARINQSSANASDASNPKSSEPHGGAQEGRRQSSGGKGSPTLPPKSSDQTKHKKKSSETIVKSSTAACSGSSTSKVALSTNDMQCKELFVRLENMDSSRILSEVESRTTDGVKLVRDEKFEEAAEVDKDSDVDDDDKSIASDCLSVGSVVSKVSSASKRSTRSSRSSSCSSQANPGDEAVRTKLSRTRRVKTGPRRTKSSEDALGENQVEETTGEGGKHFLGRRKESVKSKSADSSDAEQVEETAERSICSLNRNTQTDQSNSVDSSDLEKQVEENVEAPSTRSYWKRLESTKVPTDYSIVNEVKEEIKEGTSNSCKMKSEPKKGKWPDSSDSDQAEGSLYRARSESVKCISADPSDVENAEETSEAPITRSRQRSESVEFKSSGSSDLEKEEENAEEPTTRTLRRRSDLNSKLDNSVEAKKTKDAPGECVDNILQKKTTDTDNSKSVDTSDAEQLDVIVESNQKTSRSSLSHSSVDSKNALVEGVKLAPETLPNRSDCSRNATDDPTKDLGSLSTSKCSTPSLDGQNFQITSAGGSSKTTATKVTKNAKVQGPPGRSRLASGCDRQSRLGSTLPGSPVVIRSTQRFPILVTDDRKAVAMKDRTYRGQLVKIIILERRDEILPETKFGEDKRYPIRGGKPKQLDQSFKEDQDHYTSKSRTLDNLMVDSASDNNCRTDSPCSSTGVSNIDKSCRLGDKLKIPRFHSEHKHQSVRDTSEESTASLNEHSLLSISSHSIKDHKIQVKDFTSKKSIKGKSGLHSKLLLRENRTECDKNFSDDEVASQLSRSKASGEEVDPLAQDDDTDDVDMYDSCDSTFTEESADLTVNKKSKLDRRAIRELAINNAKCKKVKETSSGMLAGDLAVASDRMTNRPDKKEKAVSKISTVAPPVEEEKGGDEGAGILGRPKRQPKATQKLLESIESGSLGLMSMSKLIMEKMELKRKGKKELQEKRDHASADSVPQPDTAKEKKGEKVEEGLGSERSAADDTVFVKKSVELKTKSNYKSTNEVVDSKKSGNVSEAGKKSTSHKKELVKKNVQDPDLEYLEKDVSCYSEPESEAESAEECDLPTVPGDRLSDGCSTPSITPTSQKGDGADKTKPIACKVTTNASTASASMNPPANLSAQVKRGADALGLTPASSKKVKLAAVGCHQEGLSCCGTTYKCLPELHLHLIKMTGSGDVAHREKLIGQGFVCCTHCKVWIRNSMITVHLQNIHNITSKTASTSTLEIQKVVINLKKQTVPTKRKDVVHGKNKKVATIVEKSSNKQTKKGTGKAFKQKPVVNLGERINLDNSEDPKTSGKNVIIVENSKPALRGILTNKNAAETVKLNESLTTNKKKKSVTLKSPNYKRFQEPTREDSSDSDFHASDDDEDSLDEVSDSSSSRCDAPPRPAKKRKKNRSVSNIDEFDDEDEYCPRDLQESETLPVSERSFQSSIENNSGKVKIKASLRSSRRSSLTPLKPLDKGKKDRKNGAVSKEDYRKARKFKALKKNKKYSNKNRGGSSESSSSSEDQRGSSEDESVTGESCRSGSEEEVPTQDKENIPLVDLDMYTFPSGNDQLTILLVDPQNHRLKIYANMGSIFVSDPFLGDNCKYHHQASYLTENNNIIYVHPKHNLFPNVNDTQNHVPQPIIVMKTAKLGATGLTDKVQSPGRSVLKDANSNTVEGRIAVSNKNVSDLLSQIMQQKAVAAVASVAPSSIQNEPTPQQQLSSPSPSKKLRAVSRQLTPMMSEENLKRSEQTVEEPKPSQGSTEHNFSDSLSESKITPKDLLAQLVDTTLNSSDMCFEKNMFLPNGEAPDVVNEDSIQLPHEVDNQEVQNDVTTIEGEDHGSSENLPHDQAIQNVLDQYQLPPSKFSPSGQTVYIIRKANTQPQQKFVLSASGQTASISIKQNESIAPRLVPPSNEVVVPTVTKTVLNPIIIRTHSHPKSLSNSPVVTTFSTNQICRDLIDMETLEPLNKKISSTKVSISTKHKDSIEEKDSAHSAPSTSTASSDLSSQPSVSDVLATTSSSSKSVTCDVVGTFSKPLSPLKSPLQEGNSKAQSPPKKSAWSYLDDDSDEFLSTLEFTDHLQSPSHFENSDGNESGDAMRSGGIHTTTSTSQSYLPKVPSNLLEDVKIVKPDSNRTQDGEGGGILDINEVKFFASPPRDGSVIGNQTPSLASLGPPSFTPRRSRRSSLRTPDNKANAQELLSPLQFTPGHFSDLATPGHTPKSSSSESKMKSPGLVTPPMAALPPPTFISPPSRKRLVNFDETAEESSPGQSYSGLAYSCLSDNDIFGLWPGGSSLSSMAAADTSAASPNFAAMPEKGTPLGDKRSSPRNLKSEAASDVCSLKNRTPLSDRKFRSRQRQEDKSPKESAKKLDPSIGDDSTDEGNFDLAEMQPLKEVEKDNSQEDEEFLIDELPDISGGSIQFDLDSIEASLDLQDAEGNNSRDLTIPQAHPILRDSNLSSSIGKVIEDESDCVSSEDSEGRQSAPPTSPHAMPIPSPSPAGATPPLAGTSPAKIASGSECFKRNRRKGNSETSLSDHDYDSRDGRVSTSDAGFTQSTENSPEKRPKFKLAVSFEDGSVPLEFSLDSFIKSNVLQSGDSHDENQEESVISPTRSFSTTHSSSATVSEETDGRSSKQSTSTSLLSAGGHTLDMPTPLTSASHRTNVHLGVTPCSRPLHSHFHQPLSSTPLNASTLGGPLFTAQHEQFAADSDDLGCISETEEAGREDEGESVRHKKPAKHKDKRSKSKKKRREKSRSRSREGSKERTNEDLSLKLKINLKGMTSQMVTPECRKFKKYREKSKKRKHRNISDILSQDSPNVEPLANTNQERLHHVESIPISNKNSCGKICTDIVQLVSEKVIRSPYENQPSAPLETSDRNMYTEIAGPSKPSENKSIKDYFTTMSRNLQDECSSFTLPDKSFYLGLERPCAFDELSDEEDTASDAPLVSPTRTPLRGGVDQEDGSESPVEPSAELPEHPSPCSSYDTEGPAATVLDGRVPDKAEQDADDHPDKSSVSEAAEEDEDSNEDLSQELPVTQRSSRCSRSKSREDAEEPQWRIASGNGTNAQTNSTKKFHLHAGDSSVHKVADTLTSGPTPHEDATKVSSLTLTLSTSRRTDASSKKTGEQAREDPQAASLDCVEEGTPSAEESDSGVVSPRQWLQRGAKLRAAVLIQDQQVGITDSQVAGSLDDVLHHRRSPSSLATSSNEKAQLSVTTPRNSAKVPADVASGKRVYVTGSSATACSEDTVTPHYRRTIGSPPRKILRSDLSPDGTKDQTSRIQTTSATSRRRSSLLEIPTSPADEAVLSPKRPLRIRRSSDVVSERQVEIGGSQTQSDSVSSPKPNPTSYERTWHSRGAKLKAQVMISDQQGGFQDSSVVPSVEKETVTTERETENFSPNDIRKFFLPKPKITTPVPSSTTSASTPSELRKDKLPRSDIRAFFLPRSPVQPVSESPSGTSPVRGKKRLLEDTVTEEDSDMDEDTSIDVSSACEEEGESSSSPKHPRACFTDVNIPVSNLKLWYDLRCSRMAFVSGTLETSPGNFEGFPLSCLVSLNRAKAIRRCVAQLNIKNWYKSQLFSVPLDHIVNWDDEQLVTQLDFD